MRFGCSSRGANRGPSKFLKPQLRSQPETFRAAVPLISTILNNTQLDMRIVIITIRYRAALRLRIITGPESC